MHVAEDGHPRVGQTSPAVHLNRERRPGVVRQVPRVHGQRGEAEDGEAVGVRGEVHRGGERVPGPSVVHVGHDRRQVRVVGELHQVPRRNRDGGQIRILHAVQNAARQRGP